MDQSPGGEEGRSGLVAFDVHANQTVDVKGSAGQLFDLVGRGEDVCFVPEFRERL